MDLSAELQAQVQDAYASDRSLCIMAGGTKSFYGRPVQADAQLSVSGNRGLVDYRPEELFLRARAGTTLAEINATLAERGQGLACEPPAFGTPATLGGALACGLSGPARPYAGSLRDQVLGMRILNGRGEDLQFGGQVMKNVAGYDLSRFMVGALGTLGVILEATLKVLPLAPATITLVQECTPEAALQRWSQWGVQPLPLSASAHLNERLYLRLSGTVGAVTTAQHKIGGSPLAPTDADRFWADLREQRLPFFAGDAPLWRFSVAPATPPFLTEIPQVWEWGGAVRWLHATQDPTEFRAVARQHGGHATLFRGSAGANPFSPMPSALLQLHRRLKLAFDPRQILNPGHLYPEL